MASLTSAISVQVNTEDKEAATAILQRLGVSMSGLINMTLKQVIMQGGIPFEVKEPRPSKEMLKALKEAKDIAKNPDKYKGYHNIDQMFDDILNE